MDGTTLLRQFRECLARGDAEGASSLFTPDATYDEPPGHSLAGRAALHAFIAAFAASHTGVTFTVVRTLESPGGALVAAEWRWAYTRTADGQRRVFEGMSFIELRDGLIARWRGFSARIA